MGKFINGVSINEHSAHHNGHSKMKHLRIRAGKQRDQYVHLLVFHAKIMGGREAWAMEHPGQPVPETDFYRYLDLTYETVDHDDNDSLNNSPENLNRMTRGKNAAKANGIRAARKRQKKQETAPF
jgi:hypothetical protein